MNIMLTNDVCELETTKFMHFFIIVCFQKISISTSDQVMLNVLITLDPSLQMVIIWKEFLQKVDSCHASMLA